MAKKTKAKKKAKKKTTKKTTKKKTKKTHPLPMVTLDDIGWGE